MMYHNSVKSFVPVDFEEACENLIRVGSVSVLKNMEKEYSMNKSLIQSNTLDNFKNDSENFMNQMGDSKIKKIAEEVASKININEFKDVMGPLMDSDKGPENIDFMKILGNPKVMELAQNVAGTI